MADTTIANLTDGNTAVSTDRIPVERSPFGSGQNRYITPGYIATLIDAAGEAAAAVATHAAAGDPHPGYALESALGDLAALDTVNNSQWSGTDLAVANGGTGASTEIAAAAALKVPYIIQKSGVTVTAPTDTSNNVVLTVPVDAGVMGDNGALRLFFRGVNTSNGNVKTVRVYIGASGAGTGGTLIGTLTVTNSALTNGWVLISNANAANSQQTTVMGGTNLIIMQALTTAAIDTDSAWEVAVAFQKATGSDTMTLNQSVAELLSDGT